MAKLYYWRRSRINPMHLSIVFCNRDDRCGLGGSVKSLSNDVWEYIILKSSGGIKGEAETEEVARTKVEELINDEFRPEYIPYFG